MKSNKGITLIVLVITILLMLILAGITIAALTNGGILDYAKASTIAYDSSAETEIIERAKAQAKLGHEEFKINGTGILQALSEIVGEENYTSSITEEGISITFKGSGRNYLIEYDDRIKPEYFYIYTARDCNVERILITEEIRTNGYNITSKVDPNNYYAGYYSVYGGSNTDVSKLAYVNNKAIDEEGEIYDYSRTKTSKNTRYWNRTDACTQSGLALIPEDGKVYYLKEMPSIYLQLMILPMVDTSQYKRLADIFFFSAINDSYYSERKFEILHGDEVIEKSSVPLTGYTTIHGSNGSQTTVRAQDFDNVTAGYLMIINGVFATITPEMQFTVRPYVVTYDGVRVNGVSKTLNTGIDENGNCTENTLYEITN